MADVQKPVEVPAETVETSTAPVAEPVAEVKPTEPVAAATTETAPATETAAVEETKPAEATEEAAKTEDKAEEKKEEVVPVEEGHLSHKAQGLSFPKNLISNKEFFFFGTDAFEPKSLDAYKRTEKTPATAHSNIAWASETGKGLLFVGDKKAPTGIISLADASEPEVDGTNKFHLTHKGNKHTFKAANAAERDNWVSQLKLKIAEAKELSATVTESETYKKTIESFKPAVVAPKKEETPVEAAKTEEAKVEEPVKAEETPKEEVAKTEEAKVEEPAKRRSASRKRGSFFGFGKKDEKPVEAKEEEVKAEETAAVTPVAETAAAAAIEEPKTEEPVAAAEPAVETAAATTEDKPVVDEAKPAVTPTEKPANTKRNSFFGVFGKKEKKAAEAKPVDAPSTEATKEAEPAVETAAASEEAPVIPPVETSTPLAVDVSNPATVPVETVDATPAPAADAAAAPVGDKKDLKEKRKSSLPFAFGKRDKSPSPVEGEEKTSKSAFSKFRATIKGKSTPKADEKPAEVAAEDKPVEAGAATEEAKPAETEVAPTTEAATTVEEPAKATETTEETKPENVATTTPAVTAAA